MYQFAYRTASLVLAVSTCAGATRAGDAPDRAPLDNVRILDPAGAWAVRRARDRAFRKLAEPGCQRIFSDFRDRAGRPLQQALADSGQTGREYLASLLFYDGSAHPRCHQKHIFAVTQPGELVILVCVANFAEIALQELRLATAILIHEELHALGLGENPPSSAEITDRVLGRCY